jgi:maltose/moltooligosaccharide transporter
MGFQMQSLFVGAGIVLANASIFVFQDWFGGGEIHKIAGTVPRWLYYSFFIGAIASVSTILWSVLKTPEIPPPEEEIKEIQEFNKNKPNQLIQILSAVVVIFSLPLALGLLIAYYLFPVLLTEYNFLVVIMLAIAFVWLFTLFRLVKTNKQNRIINRLGDLLGPIMEATRAISEMPKLLRQLTWVYFFQWYALFIYWQFVAPMSVESMGISEGAALGQAAFMNMVYNATTMIVALVLVPFASKYGNKRVYAVSLFLTGIAMLSMPYIHNRWFLIIPMIFFGIGWAAMMGIPYSMVSKVIPQERRGVYMGIINMMIVIPMLIQTITFGPIIKNFLNNSAVSAILFGGVFFLIAGTMAMFLTNSKVSAD